MMNTWNDLIKSEPNIAGMGGGGIVAGNNSGPNLYDNDVMSTSQNGPAAVAAAVATAAMMMSSSGMAPVSNSYGNNPNMMMSNHMDDCGLDDDDTMDNDDDDCNSSVNNDAEGVWSPDIEQSFQEALAIYPPCGRRKIILSEEGKMYGRNELIARYIKVRTGKSRSRKQVSSHIQVLAKRKTKDFHNHLKDGKDGKIANGTFPNPFSHLTSAQIISPAPVPLQPQQQPQQQQQPTNHLITNGNANQSQLMTNQNTNNIQPSVVINPAAHNLPNQQQQPQLLINQRNNNPNGHHQSQLLQNCTNLMPNTNSNGLQSPSCIWGHPGLQPEKKARTLNMPSSSSLPCSTSSSTTSSNDDLIPSSSSSTSSSSSQNNENNRNMNHHHTHHHNSHNNLHSHHHNNHSSLSPPDSLSPQNNQLNQSNWITNYNSNNTNASNNLMSNKSVVGLQQLRLIEFSGFIEQRHEPELYHKHLFVHLNTSDYNLFNCFNSNKNETNKQNDSDDFELINYKEFADKFPENDLLWSVTTNNEKPSSSSSSSSSSAPLSVNSAGYLIKFWVDLNYSLEEGVNSVYAVTNIFESSDPITISCSTKVCSFGNQVVEKVETEHGRYESSGRYVYRIESSPMCEYMITFINKLKQLPEKSLQNSVLENFSVLQLIKNHDTQELLLTLAYVFEVSTSEHGAQHVIYKLSNK